MEDCIRISRTKLTLGEMLGNERSKVMEGNGMIEKRGTIKER